MKHMVTWDRLMTSGHQKRFSEQMQDFCPFLESEILGWTAGGREIQALKLGVGERKILLTAAHHANEGITALLLWRFLEDYCRGLMADGRVYGFRCAELYEKSTLYAVPLVNPDGVDLVAGAAAPDEWERAWKLAQSQPEIPFPSGWKANGQGVDLNLNYPARWEIAAAQKMQQPGPRDYPGAESLNQAETEILADYTRRICPDVMGAWHTQGREIYAADPDGTFRDRELAQLMAAASGYALGDPLPESSNAGFRDWFLQEFPGTGFTVEAGFGTNPLPLSDLPQLYQENLPLFVLLLFGVC